MIRPYISDKRAECKAEFLKNAPGKFGYIEKQLKGKDGFFDGKVTWPDLMLYSACGVVTWAELDCVFKDCNKIKAVRAKFAENEKFKAHYAKYPPPPKV